MLGQKETVDELFAHAGVAINGSNPWDMEVQDENLYARLLKDRSLGLGEAYMDGLWRCRQLGEMIYRLLRANLDEQVRASWRFLLPFLSALLWNPQSRWRARDVAERHYDLGNDLFLSFLDPYNQYSCAYFADTDDLAEAQRRKLDLICRKLALKEEDRVLDIGCGWGGLARYAAERYGCEVTGVTISREQARYAEDFCRDLPVRILLSDYREVTGRFDKVVSVGMFEHVGQKNYRLFMEVVDRVLADDGIFLLHTIGGNASVINCDPWISKYIFPNGMLPSIAQIGKAAEGLFVMEDWHNIGPHYARTLSAWHENFQKSWRTLRDRYNERFKRMWEYYLLSCSSAFRARKIQAWQIVLTRCGRVQPECRRA